MPVTRRKNGSWLISIYHPAAEGGRFRKTLPGDLAKRDVEALERRYWAKFEAREHVGRRVAITTVADMLARYWNEHGQHLASAASERGYLDRWSDDIGDRTPIDQVTPDRIAEVVADWRSTPHVPKGRRKPMLVTASTINHRIACLQRVWSRAEEVWRWTLPRVHWRRLRLDEPEPAPRRSPDDLLQAYLDALPPRSLFPTLMALHTGLRRGGCLRITRADLDFKAGVIHTISKGRAGGKLTPVPMTQPVLAVLAMMGRLPDIGPIFVVTKDELRKDRERARRVAGLGGFRFHDLRHHFAQEIEDAGEGDKIKAALHHSDPKMRERYSRTKLDSLREALDRVAARKRKGTNGA